MMAPASSAFSVRGTRGSLNNRAQSKTKFGMNKSKFFMRCFICPTDHLLSLWYWVNYNIQHSENYVLNSRYQFRTRSSSDGMPPLNFESRIRSLSPPQPGCPRLGTAVGSRFRNDSRSLPLRVIPNESSSPVCSARPDAESTA